MFCLVVPIALVTPLRWKASSYHSFVLLINSNRTCYFTGLEKQFLPLCTVPLLFSDRTLSVVPVNVFLEQFLPTALCTVPVLCSGRNVSIVHVNVLEEQGRRLQPCTVPVLCTVFVVPVNVSEEQGQPPCTVHVLCSALMFLFYLSVSAPTSAYCSFCTCLWMLDQRFNPTPSTKLLLPPHRPCTCHRSGRTAVWRSWWPGPRSLATCWPRPENTRHTLKRQLTFLIVFLYELCMALIFPRFTSLDVSSTETHEHIFYSTIFVM